MQCSLTLPRKCPPSKTTLNTQWWAWKVDLDIIVCCLGFAWVFLAVLGHPDRCPTHRALLPAASTSLHVLLLSHPNSAGMEATRAAAQDYFWLPPCLQKVTWTLFNRRQWRGLATSYGKYPPLPFHVRKGNSDPQRRQEKAAPQDKIWESSGAKQTCQRQLLFVNKYGAKDKASPLLHPLKFFCDEWLFRSTRIPGRRGLQECLHLCNFISSVHNYPTHPRLFFFFLLKKK